MTLGHQCQELAFTRGQRPQGVVSALSGQQLCNDLRVEHRRALGDPNEDVQKLLDPGDPVLQQVPDRTGAVREQIAGVGGLHILAEHQHGGAGQLRAGRDRRAQALVGVGRRHPYIDDRDVRAVVEHRLDQGGAVTDRGYYLVTVLGEQADQSLAQKYRVVGQDDPQLAAGRVVRWWFGCCIA